MLRINDEIELQTNSDINKLLFETRYLVQRNYTFDISIRSNEFSAKSHFCVSKDDIDIYVNKLSNMNLMMIGTARLNDIDSDAFIEFSIELNGHLTVFGQLGGSYEDHFMKFKFRTDQTVLPKFIKDFNLLNKYEDLTGSS